MQFTDHAADALGTPCPLDECFAATTVAVSTGTTTVPLPGPRGGQANSLAGLQWELALPGDGSKSCSADFTIDDIRLVVGP